MPFLYMHGHERRRNRRFEFFLEVLASTKPARAACYMKASLREMVEPPHPSIVPSAAAAEEIDGLLARTVHWRSKSARMCSTSSSSSSQSIKLCLRISTLLSCQLDQTGRRVCVQATRIKQASKQASKRAVWSSVVSFTLADSLQRYASCLPERAREFPRPGSNLP